MKVVAYLPSNHVEIEYTYSFAHEHRDIQLECDLLLLEKRSYEKDEDGMVLTAERRIHLPTSTIRTIFNAIVVNHVDSDIVLVVSTKDDVHLEVSECGEVDRSLVAYRDVHGYRSAHTLTLPLECFVF